MLHKNNYALITAVKNEEKYIENTIKSILSQEKMPDKWVIVNDNSTDSTGEIIKSYAEKIHFISCLDKAEDGGRNFASKARALKQAVNQMTLSDYAFIGNLDADITFAPHFYATLIGVLSQDPSLGCIGGTIWEKIEGEWKYNHSNPDWSVGGATHFFRADLFEKIGSYPELKYGGEDTVVEYMVRDHGYTVKAIRGLGFYHHKPSGPEFGKGLSKNFLLGRQEYFWGSSLTFELLKCVKRTTKKPFISGAIARLLGYLLPYVTLRRDGLVAPDIRHMVTKQQKKRIVSDLKNLFPLTRNHKRRISHLEQFP